MDKQAVFQQLVLISEAIENQNAVAVLGAGVSASLPNSGYQKSKQGNLPLGKNLVTEFAKRRTYIEKSLSLPEAAFAIKQREGKPVLLSLLQDLIDKNISPLPAHHILAKLPFMAYVSFNFDELLEHALRDAGRIPRRIIQDKDVSIARPGSVTVIKPHGTISDPDTIKIASDEILDLNISSPLLVSLLKITMTQRRLLYLGFGLNDPDFISMHHNVVKTLGEYAPVATAVVLSATEHERVYWREQGITVVEMEVSQFLQQLSTIRIVGDESDETPLHILENDPWLQDPFFQKLLTIRSLPSETQVIEALLEQLETEAEKVEPETLKDRLIEAVGRVLKYRPNYRAFEKVGKELVEILEKSQNKRFFQEGLRNFRRGRRNFGESLAASTSSLIDERDNIYIYSQSIRVVDSLRAVAPAVQETCTIYIGECRPKSPIGFQDAYAIYEKLQDTHYKLRLIPDAAFAHLADRHQINKVIMGAHQLCRIGDNIEYFVNTCGTLAIVRICEWYKIPVIVVAEADKIEDYDDRTQLDEVSRDPEENLSRAIVADLSKIRNVSPGIVINNYGYDVSPVASCVEIATTKEID